MRARLLSPLFPVALAVLLAGSLVAQATQAPVLTVHSIWGTREFASDLVSPTWTKDGTAYTTIETDSAGHTDLFRVDAVSGKQERLVRGVDLVPPGAAQPVAIEEYRFSSDGARLLIFTNSARVWRQNTKGTYYVWDLAARRLIPVSTQPGYQMFAKFSPDGRMVAFVRANNIYVTDLTTGAETAVTADGNGRPRSGQGHLRRRDGLRGHRGRDLANPAQPASEPARPAARRRTTWRVTCAHDRQRLGVGGREPAPVDQRRETVPVRLRARRLRPGVSGQPGRLAGPTNDPGRVGRAAGLRRRREAKGAVLQRRDRWAARPPPGADRARWKGPHA